MAGSTAIKPTPELLMVRSPWGMLEHQRLRTKLD